MQRLPSQPEGTGNPRPASQGVGSAVILLNKCSNSLGFLLKINAAIILYFTQKRKAKDQRRKAFGPQPKKGVRKSSGSVRKALPPANKPAKPPKAKSGTLKGSPVLWPVLPAQGSALSLIHPPTENPKKPKGPQTPVIRLNPLPPPAFSGGQFLPESLRGPSHGTPPWFRGPPPYRNTSICNE